MFTGFAWNPIGGDAGGHAVCSMAGAVIGTYGLSALVVTLAGAALVADHTAMASRCWTCPPLLLLAHCCSLAGRSRRQWPQSSCPSASSSPISASRTNGGRASTKSRPDRLDRLTIQGTAGHAPRLLARGGGHRAARGRPHRRRSATTEVERLRATRSLGPGDLLLTGGLSSPRATAGRSMARPTASIVLEPLGRIRRPLRQGAPRALWRISADAAAAVADRPVAARARRHRFRRRPGPAHDPVAGRLGQGRLPALLRDHLLGRSRRPAQPPRLHLQPLERRLVRRAGARRSISPRRGCARSRKGLPVHPLDPHRDQRGDRSARARGRSSLPWRTAGRDRRHDARRARRPRLFARLGNIIPLALGFLLLIAAIALSRRASLQRAYKDFLYILIFRRFQPRTTAFHAQHPISSRPNRFPKAIPTRSPTRSATRSSICSCRRTPRRASPARR